MTPLKIKEIILVPTDIQIVNIPIGSTPFNVHYTHGKIVLCLICDDTETITEELRIDINAYNQPITFNTNAVFLNTFDYQHPSGKGYAILHVFATMRAKNIIIPSMNRSLHDLVKELRA